MFWCQRCWCSDSWKQWTEKSHLSFCSTVLVYITRMFGVFDPDRLKLQGHHPRLKCSMVLSGGKCCEKICTMENVFLMCFCERLSACHLYLQCFSTPQRENRFSVCSLWVTPAKWLQSERNTLPFQPNFLQSRITLSFLTIWAQNHNLLSIHNGKGKLSWHMISST